jgi:hypothetical protein
MTCVTFGPRGADARLLGFAHPHGLWLDWPE